jgi:hypothetical protein
VIKSCGEFVGTVWKVFFFRAEGDDVDRYGFRDRPACGLKEKATYLLKIAERFAGAALARARVDFKIWRVDADPARFSVRCSGY